METTLNGFLIPVILHLVHSLSLPLSLSHRKKSLGSVKTIHLLLYAGNTATSSGQT